MGQAASLDGLGFLQQTVPVPTKVAILQAQVQSPAGVETMFVLALDTPTGTHVTYWNRDALDGLIAKLQEAATGLTIARDTSALAVVQHGN